MEHTIRQIETKELTDDHVSFRFRCCDDESTDSWCTVSLALTADELSEAINGHKTRMAQMHERKLAFRNESHLALEAAAESVVKV